MEYVVRVGWTGETYSAILVNEDDPRDIICEGLGETEERALSDLEDKRTVSYQQGKELAETYGMQFIETSAKSNTNVDEAFHLLGKEVMKLSLNDKEKNFGNKNKMKLDKKTEDIVFQQKQGCCGGKK